MLPPKRPKFQNKSAETRGETGDPSQKKPSTPSRNQPAVWPCSSSTPPQKSLYQPTKLHGVIQSDQILP